MGIAPRSVRVAPRRFLQAGGGRGFVAPARSGLFEVWDERDDRYAQRKAHERSSAAMVAAVRINRIQEAGSDPVARTIAARWTPPERMQ